MTISLNARLDEQATLIQASSLVALASTPGAGKVVSLKGYHRATIILDVLNATTITGGVVVLKQSTTIAGTPKALSFTRMLANIDVAASQALVETAVVANTFTTDTTNSKRLRYVLDVQTSDLDIANNYVCFQAVSTLMANAIGMFTYILYGARYGGGSLIDPTVD